MEATSHQMTDLCRAASYHEQGCVQESPACPTDTHSCGVKCDQITLHWDILIKEHIL